MTRGILSLVLLAAAACNASGQGGASLEGIGPIGHVLPEGRNGVWVGQREGAIYRMTNHEDSGTIQYYFLDPVPGTEGRRTIEVKVAIDTSGSGTRAGLVYGVTPNPTTYYFYLVEPDGRVVLFRRERDASLTEVMSTTVRAGPGEFVTLGIVEQGHEARFLVNGVEAASRQTSDVGRGGAGIAAGGTGVFTFAGFRHDPPPIIPGASERGAEPTGPEDGVARAGWRRHETPGVFTMDLPPGSLADFDSRNGYVTVTGDGGERAYLWPVFSSRPLDRARAAGVLARLASQLVPGTAWGQSVAVGQDAIRIESRDPDRTSVASLRWASNQSGSAALCYVSLAPASRYGERANTIARVLASFRPIVPAGAAPAAATTSLRFTVWRDPGEGAFQTDVPAGWRVEGGLQRRTAIDYQRGVRVTSPDGQIEVFHMDPSLPAFTLPDQTTVMLGQGEGTWYTAPDGTRMLIRRYAPGGDFAGEYAAGRFGNTLTGGRIEQRQDRPDAASVVHRSFLALNEAGGGLIRHSATAGEVRLSGQRAGRSFSGYVFATTVLGAFQMGGGVWEVRELFGFLAPAERAGEAAQVMRRLVTSFRWDSQWYWRQHQTRAAVGDIMADYSRRMGEVIGRTLPRPASAPAERLTGSPTTSAAP